MKDFWNEYKDLIVPVLVLLIFGSGLLLTLTLVFILIQKSMLN